MPERRFDHIQEVEDAGLGAPDAETMHFLWQIVDEGVLGASRHVALGNQLILHLIESSDDGLRRAMLAADFIARTRGTDTPVIGNSLRLLLSGLDTIQPAQQSMALKNRVIAWNEEAAARKDRLVQAAARHLDCVDVLMAFDYSSTVSAIVIAMAKRKNSLRIVVPESRAIAGGARYLEEFLPQGLSVDFIPDAAIGHRLAKCDAVLLGVETLRADGSCLNTIGSQMIAQLAQLKDVEVYGATDLLKLDTRSYAGHRPSPAIRAYDEVLKAGLSIEGLERADTRAPELEVVQARLITALLTEFGPVSPSAIWALGRKVFELDDKAGL